jgi:deoxyribonuclease V
VEQAKLRQEQLKLAPKVILTDQFSKYNTIAGVYTLTTDHQLICGITVCDAKTFEILDKKYATAEPKFPYIPGFLSYRESPVILDAFSKLRVEPDLLILKGNGTLHPRRLGVASHIGLLLDKPTIGIAKKLLCGTKREGTVYIDKDAVAKEVKIKEAGNPVLVSPGHMVSLKTSVEIIKECKKEPYKLPLPLALAHKYANKVKKRLQSPEEAEVSNSSVD